MDPTRGARERGGRGASFISSLERISESAWFAYGSLLLIQAKVMWGIWDRRDLTLGDTAGYYVYASRWAESFELKPFASPLYTSLWGSLQWVVEDPHAVTILHRLLIALAAGALVLAVLRRLLPAALAWLLAVWWAVLPGNYDVLYEVHLFAVLPAMLAIVLALSWSGLRMRVAVFTVLLAATFLIRLEFMVALLIWTAICAGYELRRRREGAGAPGRTLAYAFGVPVLVVAAVFGAAALSYERTQSLGSIIDEEHTLPMCQIYAFGYQQRNEDFQDNPFTGCERLMARIFDRETPSLLEAAEANPRAVAGHILWNLRLLPGAVQLLLLDRTSAGADLNPDFVPVHTGSTAALVGSLALAGFVIGGLSLLWRDRRRWWRAWLSERAWGWAAILSLAGTAVAVITLVRPRPSFILDLSVLLLAVIGMAAMAYADRWSWLQRLRALPPLLAVALLIALPHHYDSGYETPQVGRTGQPVKQMVDRLERFSDRLHGGVRMLATYGHAGCAYAGGDRPCKEVGWSQIADPARGSSAFQAIKGKNVRFVYADQDDLANPMIRAALDELRASGWEQLAPPSGDRGWILLAGPSR